MSLTIDAVIDYLQKIQLLKLINNHDVKDEKGCKTGQLPLTIQIGKQLIDTMLVGYNQKDNPKLTNQELNALINLEDALDSLPLSMNLQSFLSIINLDTIQKNLLKSVNVYLDSIHELAEHKLLLKAVVLVLKIIEYDLSKNPGPITVGKSFFKLQVLSDQERIDNHFQIVQLLDKIIRRFDIQFENEYLNAPKLEVTT